MKKMLVAIGLALGFSVSATTARLLKFDHEGSGGGTTITYTNTGGAYTLIKAWIVYDGPHTNTYTIDRVVGGLNVEIASEAETDTTAGGSTDSHAPATTTVIRKNDILLFSTTRTNVTLILETDEE